MLKCLGFWQSFYKNCNCDCFVKRRRKVLNTFVVVSRVLIISIIVIFSFIKSSHAATCAPCDIKQELLEKTKEKSPNYEEFVLEHQVTKAEAVSALKLMDESYFQAPPDPACKAITCTTKIMKYCHGAQFINDHCWCDQSHGKEGLPFIPHNCYVGEKNYGASIGSCYFFTEVKECCCLKALAKRWKSISSSTRLSSAKNLVISLVVMLKLSVIIKLFLNS